MIRAEVVILLDPGIIPDSFRERKRDPLNNKITVEICGHILTYFNSLNILTRTLSSPTITSVQISGWLGRGCEEAGLSGRQANGL